MNKTTGIAIAIIVIIALALLAWWYNNNRDSAADVPQTGTVVPEFDPRDFTEPETVEAANLAAVGNYEGNGTATRAFEDGTFTHTVVASLAAPASGTFYEGWLVMAAADEPQFFSTGRLTLARDGSYALTYTADQNYPNHTMVVITEETTANGLDGQPEAHVLEGEFE